jgi:hypothetical protein
MKGVTKMSITEIEAEYDKRVGDSWYEAVDRVRSQVRWLEYVPEEESTEAEQQKIVGHAKKLYATLPRLTDEYVD